MWAMLRCCPTLTHSTKHISRCNADVHRCHERDVYRLAGTMSCEAVSHEGSLIMRCNVESMTNRLQQGTMLSP